MKQLLALMSFFLVVLLGITTVMAVGSAKQSEMVVQRNQQVNTLRAELRTLKKEQEQLDLQLTAQRTAAQTLRKERDLLDQRIRRLLVLMDRQLPVDADAAFATAVSSWNSGRTTGKPGQTQLRIQALENAVSRLIAQARKSSGLLEADTRAALLSEAQTPTPIIHQSCEPPDETPAPQSLFAGLPAATPQPDESAPPVQSAAAVSQPQKVTDAPAQLAEILSVRLQQVQNLLTRIGNCILQLRNALCSWNAAV